MSQYVETPTRTFAAGGALALHARVKLAAGALALAGATDVEIGTTTRETFAAGDDVAVRLRNAQGTCKMIAAAAIASGAEVNAKASGKIDDDAAASSVKIGTALEAATADGDIIEVLRYAATEANAAA